MVNCSNFSKLHMNAVTFFFCNQHKKDCSDVPTSLRQRLTLSSTSVWMNRDWMQWTHSLILAAQCPKMLSLMTKSIPGFLYPAWPLADYMGLQIIPPNHTPPSISIFHSISKSPRSVMESVGGSLSSTCSTFSNEAEYSELIFGA